MHTSSRAGWVLAAAASLALVPAGTLGNDDYVDGIDASSSLQRDSIAYSAAFDVPLEEAVRRLRLQAPLGRDVAAAEVLAGPRFAGGWIEHDPRFQLVIRLTGNEPIPEGLQALIEAVQQDVDVEVALGAEDSVTDLLDGLRRISDYIGPSPRRALGIDVMSGSVLLTVEQQLPPSEEAALGDAGLVPLRVEVAALGRPVHTYGGRLLTSSGAPECTTGFSVYNTTTGVTGVVTAAHCDNGLTYWETGAISYPWSFVQAWNDSNQDVQWGTTTHIEYDDFWDGNSYRDVTGTVPRNQALGDFVCHYGIGSNPAGTIPGYSCGTVAQINYDPDVCPGGCDPVWVKVTGPDLACSYGDSGGPVFVSGSAYGIVASAAFVGPDEGQCGWMTFMSVDFLAPAGLAVRTSS